MTEEEFEPRIMGFLCNWCSYAGADLAGISRIQHAPNLRVIRVMCSGRVDLSLILNALLDGDDGVLVLGCHPGDCHYLTSNLEAREKFDALKTLLDGTKAGKGRFDYDWVSAAEGQRYATEVGKYIDHIKSLGPSIVKDDEEARLELRAVLREVSDFRFRWLVGRQRRMLLDGDSYGEPVDKEELAAVVNHVLREQFIRSLIIELTAANPATVEELAELTNTESVEVLRHVQRLRAKGVIDLVGSRDHSPLYRVAPGVVD